MRLKSSILLAVAFGAGIAQGAFAADMPVKAQRAILPYSWTGLYVGGSIGWLGTNDIGGPFEVPVAPGNSFIAPGQNGAFGGGHIGAQYQWNNLVLGVEGGVRRLFSNSYSSTPGIGNAPPSACNSAVVFTCQARLGTIWQVGPRLGWAFDKFLVFGTGGWARAQIDTQASVIATGAILAQGGDHHSGSFVGGGVEWAAFSYSNVDGVFGLDYTHYHFNAVDHNPGVNGRFVSTNADAVTARFSLKFGPSIWMARN